MSDIYDMQDAYGAFDDLYDEVMEDNGTDTGRPNRSKPQPMGFVSTFAGLLPVKDDWASMVDLKEMSLMWKCSISEAQRKLNALKGDTK